MTIIQILILFAVFFLCIVSVLVFYFQNKKEQQLHIRSVRLCMEQIKKNKKQVQLRNTYLNHYNFIKQNLNEALHVQHDIDLT